MNKLTTEERLHKLKWRKPGILYPLLGGVWKIFVVPKYKPKFNYLVDFKKITGPFIMVSNHTSRADYMFTGSPILNQRMNFVAGYNEFFRSHLHGVFELLHVIPKKNFTADIFTIKKVSQILKAGGRICIYPEGMNSISGENQPVAVGTGKFLKHFNVPVYYTKIMGGYLTGPKYNLNDRIGPVEVELGQMFTVEELSSLSPEEIEDKLNHQLYHDAYAWNKEKKYHYVGKTGICENMHDLLFWCPKCHKEFTMKGEGNKFYCTSCGNGVTIDDTYEMTPFDDTCVIPATQTEWFRLQRAHIKELVKDPAFFIEEEVELGNLPKYGFLKNLETSEIVGSGKIRFDHSGLTYTGTRNGVEFSFHLDSKDVPTYGMCTDITRFYTFYNGEFMEFYPKNHCVEKWFLVTEEIHKLNGGKWKNVEYPLK